MALTTKQINDSFIKCKMIAESIYGNKVPNMKVFVNTRLGKRTLGQCRFVMGVLPQIEINPMIPFDKLDNTMIHEIAHAICGPAEGHTPKWKHVGDTIGQALGQTVTRTSRVEWEYSGERYTVSCPSCGYKWFKTRQSNATKYPHRYTCPCGHKGLVCTQHY